MDLISKDFVLNTDDEENIDDMEEVGNPEEFKEEGLSTEDGEEA
ncbi:MAG: hypothetical protein AAB378_03185 [Patescibacteria group bacterium]